MSDEMMFGIAKMPYEMAMQDELSRRQFYANTQRLAAALEAARRNAGMLAPPEGYALISVEVLRAWGKLDELRECCQYPKHATSQPAAVDGCHCGTCTCNPNMTPAVRFDLSPAQMEGAIREHLIRLGWTPPDEHAQQPATVDDVVVERIAALLHEETTGEPWTVAGVEHPGPDRDYYRGLARKVAALAAQHQEPTT